jgi:processive 1,2-diacylglycerol beta-glucosyltransferase
VEAELVDLFALRAPRFNNLSRRGYVKLINTAPKLWSGIYRWLDESSRAPAVLRTLASHRRLLGRIIAEKQPAALVSTYPVYAWLINQLRTEGKVTCPLFTVITDALTINSLWYRAQSDGWFVTDHDSAAFLRARGLPAERVHVSGFPVALAFADRAAALQPPEPASPARPRRVLFMINSSRATALPIAAALLEQRDWRITFTAGRDAGLQRELQQMAQGAPARAEVLGWTDRIPELLMTHHAVISKAGGATTQESINAPVPADHQPDRPRPRRGQLSAPQAARCRRAGHDPGKHRHHPRGGFLPRRPPLATTGARTSAASRDHPPPAISPVRWRASAARPLRASLPRSSPAGAKLRLLPELQEPRKA